MIWNHITFMWRHRDVLPIRRRRHTIKEFTTWRRLHDDVIKRKHFPRYWSFARGIHRSPVNSQHKGQWRRALMFSLISASNKRLSKQSWGWWFETSSSPLWRHRNGFRDPVRGNETHHKHRLTHWGPDKMAAVSETTFSNAFSWMKMIEYRLKFHWSLFPGVQLTILQHWFR